MGKNNINREAKPLTYAAARSTEKISEEQMEESLKHLEIAKDRKIKSKLYFYIF